MSPWVGLYREHSRLREHSADPFTELKGPLRRLADLKEHCHPSLPWLLKKKQSKCGTRLTVFTVPQPNATDAGPVALRGLPDLVGARLSIQATFESKTSRIQHFSVAISGQTSSSVDWTVALHLESELGSPDVVGWQADWRGEGACSHAVFHCHVGPDLDAKPKVRVPFPAVSPGHALDWVLATVVPGFDPMPWANVETAMKTPGT
ncbi:MAG: hypothetical protein H6700_06195 [Myxococcales bacterium]|nr:hypothetical protein [Myxococcales bacterium]